MTPPDVCPACGSVRSTRTLGGLCQRCVVRNLRPLAASSRDQGPAITQDPFDDLVGRAVGRYRLIQKLGEGGAGVVYAAEQETPVRRRVALKCIKPGMDTRSVITRFEAERQALALMDHPGIATVFDAGATSTGRPYFVMELVEGIRITQFCDEHRLSVPERLRLCIQVCQAVQHAHQKGVIHRDLKPSNVLVIPQPDAPTGACPKIIDFGIAKATGAERTEATLLTEQGQLVGTPAYMSPEQASSGDVDIDTRSDIYSLGVLLYELLTGQLPLEIAAHARGGMDRFRHAILNVEPSVPSTRLRHLAPDLRVAIAAARSATAASLLSRVAGDLDWIVMKCLEKDRDRRYDTVLALAQDLERHLGNEPVLARPPSPSYVFRKFARRNRTALALSLVGVGMLVTATAITLAFAVRAWTAESLAARRLADSEKAREDSLTARRDAENVARYLIEVFRSPDPARDGRTITVAEALGQAADRLETDLQNDPDRKSRIQAALGETYHGLGLYAEALAMFESSRRRLETNRGPADPETMRVTRLESQTLLKSGQSKGAISLLERRIPAQPGNAGPARISQLQSKLALAKAYRNSGRIGESVAGYREALSISRELLGPDHPDTLAATSEFAGSPGLTREERLSLYEDLHRRLPRVHGPEHPLSIHAQLGFATALWGARRDREAAELFEELLPRVEGRLGVEDPTSLKIRARYRGFCLAEYRMESLESVYSVDLERSRAAGPSGQAARENCLLNLAWLRRSQGRFHESESLYQQVEASLNQRPEGANSLTELTARQYHAVLYSDWAWADRTNHPAAARERARQAVTILRTNHARAIGDSRVTERRLASLQSRLGDAIAVASIIDSGLAPAAKAEALAEAESLFRKAAEVLRPVRKDQPTNYRECLVGGIRLYEHLGKADTVNEWRRHLAGMDTEPFDREEFN